MATNYFGTKTDYNLAFVKITARCFHLHPYFRARAIRWCHLNFSPADPHCYGNKFWDKIDYHSAPAKDNCTLFSPIPYFRAWAMQWCHVNFSPKDLCCHGIQPFLFKEKTGCRLTRASNAETQLVGYIAWQWDRYLVPQNVFLVMQKFTIIICLMCSQILPKLLSIKNPRRQFCRVVSKTN